MERFDGMMASSESSPNGGGNENRSIFCESIMQAKNENLSKNSLIVFTMPTLISFLDFNTLSQLHILCKETEHVCIFSPNSIGYWHSMCQALALRDGLHVHDVLEANAKKLFFDELWPARKKWDTKFGGQGPAQSFKVQVVCRFRPGDSGDDKMCLPLHQFLKLKRMQKSEKQMCGDENGSCLVGCNDPEEYVDPFLGTLMKDPVLLKTSGRVVDRQVAIGCIARRGRDPFNDKKLTMAMLEPQPQLRDEIREWTKKKVEMRDVGLRAQDMKPLVDASVVDVDLLKMLMEAEQLALAANKAEQQSRGPLSRRSGFEIDAATDGPELTEFDNADDDTDPTIPALGLAANDVENVDPGSVGPSHDNRRDAGGDFADSWKKGPSGAHVIDVNEAKSYVGMHVNGVGVKPFYFSNVHGGAASQQEVYVKSVEASVTACVNGFNATVLCYGQTGSGKTFTFFGPESGGDFQSALSSGLSSTTSPTAGLVMRAMSELLRARARLGSNGVNLAIGANFVEIYDEQVTDLLTGQPLHVRRDTGALVGAMEAQVESMEQGLEVLRAGHARKRFAATAMNERSSRSHTAVIFNLSQTRSPTSPGPTDEDDEVKMICSSLFLLDLAGSERVKKSKVEGGRLREAVNINSSLLVLGKVIASLVESRSHVPYFESKLTTLLKAAFGGDSRTTVFVNCRTDDVHGDETLQSLRFGERCSMISNSAKVAASSVSSALEALERALSAIRGQIAVLEGRNKTHLDSYLKLVNSCDALQRQRDGLAARAK